MSRRLEVLLHGQPIGTLSEQDNGTVEFRFTGEYRDRLPRPVLGQKFEDDLDKTYRSRKGEGLPDFFSNLVPEGRLREVIVESASLEPGDELSLLSFVGGDLAGAVVVQPLEGLRWREDTGGGTGEAADREEGEVDPSRLRFSLAGVQLKFSMLKEGRHFTLPAHGQEGEWIVKIPSPRFGQLPENELSMLSWARKAEFDVPECSLVETHELLDLPRLHVRPNQRALAVRRYDRSAAGRIHQEDFAQATGLPPRLKYDHVRLDLMALLVRRFVDEEAVDELVRRIALVIAIGNNDAHLKNWSLVYPDQIRAQWSPVYDQVATIAWEEMDRELALDLGGVKSFAQLDRPALERFALKAEIAPARAFRQVEETLQRLRQSWKSLRAEMPLPNEHANALREHWRRVPLLREAGGLDKGP